MDTYTLSITPRESGKKFAKAIRREGRVPCVLYGPHQAPVHFAAAYLDLRPLIHTSQTYRVAMQLDGEDYQAIVKDIVYHPVTSFPIHIDFHALTKGEKITITVPVHLEGVAPGVRAGGVLSQPLHELEVRCIPSAIPGSITIDISAMEIGDVLHVSDLDTGDDVEVLTEAERTVVTVTAPRVEAEEGAEGLGTALAFGAGEGDTEGEEGDEASDEA